METYKLLITYITLVIIAIIICEKYFANKRNIVIYTISDSVVNLSCGMLERLFDFFYAALFLQISTYLYNNVAPIQIPRNLYTISIALVLFDFTAYWFHRLSHKINFLWASHIVHHQSEELNLTTVFRVSFIAVIYRSLFFIWIPLVGFDAFTLLICGLSLGLFQLFTHSRIIGKLGFLEIFMTTPSHHRVHHGINKKYIDHNYSHIFIFWDKLFGTFTPETEEPNYGITSGFESTNPYTAQFSYWRNLFIRSKRTSHFSDKIKIFFKSPNWTPKDVAHLPIEYKTNKQGKRIHYKVTIAKETGLYILTTTFFTFLTFAFLNISINPTEVNLMGRFTNPLVLTLAGIILFSIYAHGKMFEQTTQSIRIEFIRLLMISFCALYIQTQVLIETQITILFLILNIVFMTWLIKIKFINKKIE